MKRKVSYESARRVKRQLSQRLGDQPWFVGAAIVPGAAGFAVRVSVNSPGSQALQLVPPSFQGVPIQIVERPEFELRANDSQVITNKVDLP